MDAGARDANQDIRGAQMNGQEPPTRGSASYLPQQGSTLDRGDGQFHPASVRGPPVFLSPKHQALITPKQIPSNWNATRQHAGNPNLATTEDHGQLQRGWKGFAQGGFLADDARLQNTAPPYAPQIPRDGHEPGGNIQKPPIRSEAVKVLSNGRTSIWQEYQPGPVYNQGFPCNTARKDPGSLTERGGGDLLNLNCMERKQSTQKAVDGLIIRTPAQVNPPKSEIEMNAGDNAMEDLRNLNDYFRTFSTTGNRRTGGQLEGSRDAGMTELMNSNRGVSEGAPIPVPTGQDRITTK
ncbi:hypothetical protein A1O7_02717 [Cladophialophora yegresii CBS 114405]|uniref:Uncharacterized protein n=1 Tax=Cladophialophora yegresii CBS 114405 TaxID=1182544 RepID=W9WVF7_9EURO|nr:uncharacterized protein A1O7_02717 [Cladophialophora yegresii CBS 114405]EXJ62284.1 hypothetical protein A1O7_02717 [Cladophialophora yegresii CBS 114405]